MKINKIKIFQSINSNMCRHSSSKAELLFPGPELERWMFQIWKWVRVCTVSTTADDPRDMGMTWEKKRGSNFFIPIESLTIYMHLNLATPNNCKLYVWWSPQNTMWILQKTVPSFGRLKMWTTSKSIYLFTHTKGLV